VNIKSNHEKGYYENLLIWEKERYLDAEIKRAEIVLKWIPQDVDSILDFGCGNGTFANYASSNPLHMVRLEGAFTIKYIPFVSYPLRLVWLRFRRRFPFESICPQCGFKKETSTEYARALSKKADKKADFFKRIERLIPIKITRYRWWIALYKKNKPDGQL